MKAGDKVTIKATNTKAEICAVGVISNITYYTLIVDGDLVRENGRLKCFTADDLTPLDNLIEFLDNNPNETPEPTTKVFTYEQQQELYHQGYTDCERDNHINHNH